MHAREVSPRVEVFTGTSRQPKKSCPSRATICSNAFSMSARRAGSGLRNSMPTPYAPGPGNTMPFNRHSFSKKACGNCVRMPAPSPVSGSAPVPPRCARFSSTLSASTTIRCERAPLMFTSMPMPQASCSNCGEYKPCCRGYPVEAFKPSSPCFAARRRFCYYG